jgi:hypothetical protein
MSSSAITGLSGTASAPLNLPIIAVQAAAKTQATTAAHAAAGTNDAEPILMVPTKPPLSPAVMAELIGQQSSSYGSVGGGYSSDQKPAAGLPSATASADGPTLS